MQRRIVTVGVVVVALVAVGPRVRPAGADEPIVWLAPGSELDVAVAFAPLPAEPVGAGAASAIERVLGAVAGQVAAPPSIWGTGLADRPPAGWPGPITGARRLRAPLGATRAGKPCRGCSELGDPSRQRLAALYATARFTVGDELAATSHVRLQLRANDGAVVWLNGREVARRRIARGAAPLDPASRPSGPEWETFYLPTSAVRRGDNLIAVEVRPAAVFGAPTLDLALGGGHGAEVVRGPVVERLGDATRVWFDTDLPTRAVVEIGDATGSRSVPASGGALAVHHVAELGPIAPGQAVRYRVVIDGAVGPEHRVAAPPAASQRVRFAVYGDMRGGHAVHARVVEAVQAEAPDFVVVTGDLVLRGTDEADWQRFFAIAASLLAEVPYYPVAGNHDLGQTGDEERRLGELFALPPAAGRPGWASWYSLDVAGVHIVALDSNAYDRPEQEAWLVADLAAARAAGARAIVVAVHDGPYSRGLHGGNRLAAERYAPLLVAGGVDLLLSGHDHIYLRGEKDGLRYVVTGGAGAPLYPIRCGAKGRPRCKVADGGKVALREHHYLTVAVDAQTLELCPRRPDRTALEPCLRYRLRAR